jgi:DNA-binding transcriptional LysR family regulator
LPGFLIEPELASGHLVRVLPDHRFDGPSLYAVYLTDRYRSVAAKTMLSFLKDCLNA